MKADDYPPEASARAAAAIARTRRAYGVLLAAMGAGLLLSGWLLAIALAAAHAAAWWLPALAGGIAQGYVHAALLRPLVRGWIRGRRYRRAVEHLAAGP